MTPIEALNKKSPFELLFGRKLNTEWRLITTKPNIENLNKYNVSDPKSILEIDKIINPDDEDSLVQKRANKRAQKEAQIVNVESGSESDEIPLRKTKKPTPKTRYVVKTSPKKASKTLITDITEKIEAWSPHTGKVTFTNI